MAGKQKDQPEPTKAPRKVNAMLHTLRGEQSRHAQNKRRSGSRVFKPYDYAASHAPVPSLHTAIFGSAKESPTPRAEAVAKRTAGPIPRSWVAQASRSTPFIDSPEWRQEALSLIFAHDPTASITDADDRLPSLVNLCLRVLLKTYGSVPEFSDIVSYLSPHMRRELLRYSTVHAPLSIASLYSLFEPEGHAGGEIIIVGPLASLRADFFTAHERVDASMPSDAGRGDEPSDQHDQSGPDVWDTDTEDGWMSATESYPIHSLSLLSTPLSIPTLLTLPPSLTHLALIHLPSAIPVHRLPSNCPLIEVLDLSYNEWLATTIWGEEKLLSLVRWSRWDHLRILGCRGCGITRDDDVLKKVNEGRWVDVEIIVEEPPG